MAPIDTCLTRIWVTVKVVPVVVALAAVEIVKDVALGMAWMVTVSGVVLVAVNVTPTAVAVAAVVNVKLVALVTDVATVSLTGIPGPEITVPADNDTGEDVVTVVLPVVVLAVKVVVVVVVLGMLVPVMVIPNVNALVEVVVTVVLPLVVFAVIVEDNPVLATQGYANYGKPHRRWVGRDIVHARSQGGRRGWSHAVDGHKGCQPVMVEIDDRRVIGARVTLRTARVSGWARVARSNGI